MKCNEIMQLDNELDLFLKKYNGEPIGLYGAGQGLIWYIKLAKKYNLNVVGIVDSNNFEEGKILFGYHIETTFNLVEKYSNILFIISAPGHAKEICNVLGNYIKKDSVYIFDASIDILQNRVINEYKDFILDNYDYIQKFHSSLYDEKSKYNFKNVLFGWITYNIEYFDNKCDSKQYFPEFLCNLLSDNEVFVDLGAYTGDTMLDFIEITNNKFKKIFAFEPDKSNIKVLKDSMIDNRICLYEKAVSDREEVLYFSNENGNHIDEGAHITCQKENTVKIEAVALDHVINEEISFLKMDIEGSELAALKGSKELIKKYRPKLAISIYHKKEDIIEIPQYIESLNLNYKMYVRHYWNCSGTDVILYCI